MDTMFTYPERARQLISYHNLDLGGGKMPSDLDGILEYQDTCYVLIEFKYREALSSVGQRLLLMRLCDDLQKVKPTLLIMATHDVEDPKQVVDAAAGLVARWRFKGEWHYDETTVTVREKVRLFIQQYGVAIG
jgi:hypothetical protein